MAVFNIPRAGRQNTQYMEKLIENMWNAEHLIFRRGYGIFACDVTNILCSFRAVQNAYQKAVMVKTHYMEIYVEPEMKQEDVTAVADCMGRYFYQLGYQSFVTVIAERQLYLIAIAVNAVSFAENKAFHDNNANYSYVFQYLKEIVPRNWKLTASENTFFDPKVGDGNYVHGRFA